MSRDLSRWAQLATVFMGFVALGVVLSLTREIAAPLVLAVVAAIVASPVADASERLGLPDAVGALASLALALIVLIALIAMFQPIVIELIDRLPTIIELAQDLARRARTTLQRMSEPGVAAAPPGPSIPTDAQVDPEDEGLGMPTMGSALWYAPAIMGQILIFVGAMFFFLLGRRSLYDYVALRLSQPLNRSVTAQRLRAAERQVARYFLTIAAINAMLGFATFLVLTLIGMSGAVAWGALAFILNFVIYLGPAIMVVVLTIAATGTFDGFMVLAPAAGFMMVNMVEGQFVTPALVGKRLDLNPFVVFVALVFGIWLWGPIGGIVAIPILLWTLVMARGEGVAARPAPPSPPAS